MDGDPRDGPLGGKPVLPAPTGKPAQRAQELFQRALAEKRRLEESEPAPVPSAASIPPHDYSAMPMDPPLPPVGVLPEPDSFGGGRRYDYALSLVNEPADPDSAAFEEENIHDSQEWAVPTPQPGFATLADESTGNNAQLVERRAQPREELDGPTEVSPPPSSIEDEATVEYMLPKRPPPGAAAVRPAAPVPETPEPVSQDVLENTATSTMLVEEPGGGQAFEVTINDEVFSDLSCRIAVTESGVIATFRAPDANVRRLLESEAGRLRNKLEARGLKVSEVRVIEA